VFPTPLIGDVLFSEIRDCNRILIPEYGTPHPDTNKWPDHKLVYVKTVDIERDGIFEFFYAADRENQDLYNFSHTEADIGGTKFDAISRSYVIPRKDFNPDTPAMGYTMPDSPLGLFADTHVLAQKQQNRIQEQELDSLYVAETHVYVKRTTLSAVKMNEETGRVKKSVTNLYYRGETISGTAVETLAASPTNAYWGQQTDGVFRELDQLSENWFAIIESNVLPEGSVNSSANPAKTRVINRVTPLGTDVYFTEVGAMPATVPAYGSAHYDATNWPNHKLSLISPANASGLLFTFHYVANRPTQDLYNFQFSQADIGGVKFDSVIRTYVTLRADFAPTDYEMGAVMTSDPAGLFSDTYVLSEYKQIDQQDQALNSLYVTEQLVYIKKVSLIQNDFDEYFGKTLKTTQFLSYATEILVGTTTTASLFEASNNDYWGLQSSGVVRSGKQLTAKWYAITEAEVIPSSIVGIGRTYFTTVDYTWPAVLAPNLYGMISSWEKRAGGTQKYFEPQFSKNQYSGPCRAKITETFSLSPSTSSTAVSMQPLPISISNPYFSIAIGPTLHAAETLSFTNGTTDIEFEYTVANYFVEATTPASRPAQIIASDEVKPFRGGYLRQVTTIFQPTS
jgi:hypothetical protein